MSEQIKDGGPAFPADGIDSETEFAWPSQGMTLRDYFAAKAMQGFAADPNTEAVAKTVARFAYGWADAMLAARESKP